MSGLNWTKGKGFVSATTDAGDYVATRRSGRHYLVFATVGAEPVTLGNGTLAKVKELANTHYAQITQNAQTSDSVADAINGSQDAAPAPASPEPAQAPPDAPQVPPGTPQGQPPAVPPPLPTNDPVTPLDTPRPVPMTDPAGRTLPVSVMPSAAQKTAQRPASKKRSKKARKKGATAEPQANGAATADTPPAADTAPEGALVAPARDPGKFRAITNPGNPEKAPKPKELTPEGILEWAEMLREKHWANELFLTLEGLFVFARACCGDKSGQVIRVLKQLYRNEREAASAKAPATNGKVKATPKADKAPAAPKGEKKKGRGRPPKDGVKAVPRTTEYKEVDIKPNRYGIPVTAKVSVKSKKAHPTIFGITPRAILRWMGHDGWTYDQARAVIEKLGLLRFFENTKTDHIRDQTSSGRKGNRDQGGWAGDIPELTDDQKKKLRAIKPKE
jgi:hypothetical protein